MAVYRVKIFKNLFGRATGKSNFSNTYHIETDAAIDSPAVASIVDKIVAFERRIHLNTVHFMRAIISTQVKEEVKGQLGSFTVRDLAGVGERDLGASETEFLEVVLRVSFGGATGRGGQKNYRGCLTEAMVGVGGDGSPTAITVPFNINESASEMLSQIGPGVLVLPNLKSNAGTPTRAITRVTVIGASIRQRRVKRKKKTVEDEKGALGALSEILGAVALLGSFYLTKGRLLTLPQKVNIASVAGTAAAALGNVIEQFTDGVDGPLPGPV